MIECLDKWILNRATPESRANRRLLSTECDVNCHKKCEKLTANLCGVNQKLIVEALSSVRRGSILFLRPRHLIHTPLLNV